MALILDTNIVIHLRDGDPVMTARLAGADEALAMSAISLAELEVGMAGASLVAERRRRRLGRFLLTVEVLPFAADEAAAYGRIVASLGFDRRKVLDRMIAAQAIVADRPLVTRNGGDFRDVPGLRVEEW